LPEDGPAKITLPLPALPYSFNFINNFKFVFIYIFKKTVYLDTISGKRHFLTAAEQAASSAVK